LRSSARTPGEAVLEVLGHANSTITNKMNAHVDFDDMQQAYKDADPMLGLFS
jgi:site-specific recombinase XerC